MFSKTAVEDSRVVVNLDFTLVVPKGMSYSTDPSEIGPEKVLVYTDGTRTFTLNAPKRTGMGKAYEDPVVKGVVRNYTAGLISRIYGREVHQLLLVESPGVLVLCADKSDKNSIVHFFIAADQGLYEGGYLLPQMKEKERLEAVEAVFSNIREYTATRAEAVSAVRAEQAAIDARRQKEAALKNEKMQETLQDKEKNEEDMVPVPKESTAAAGNTEENRKEAENKAPEEPEKEAPEKEEKEEAPALREDASGGSQKKDSPETLSEPAKEAAEDEEKGTVYRGQDNTAQESDVKSMPLDKAPAGTGKALYEEEKKTQESNLTADEIHIRNLEEARKRKIENLRAKYIGNPGVEAQIDNYIARCERTADRIAQEFREYIVSVQNYAAGTAFTGTSDPNYIAMLSDIEEAEDSLGDQMDKVVKSADENAANATNAKIREPYVERLIRLIDRLDKKYETLSVSMGGARTISYERPEEINEIFRKWHRMRYTLPSYIEGSEAEVEKRVSEEIQKRIADSRDAIPVKEAEIGQKKEELEYVTRELEKKNEELAAYSGSMDEKKAAVDQAQKEKIAGVDAQILELEDEIAGKEEEREHLSQSLARTFSLNVNKRRDLQAKIAAAENEADELREKLQKVQDRRKDIGAEGDQKKNEIEEGQEALLRQRDDTAERLDLIRDDLEKLQDDITELQNTIADSEEEFRHIHENYLLGKYDRVELP